MKATIKNIGQLCRIRICTYKSFRHYGGREINESVSYANAILVGLQDSTQCYLVELLDASCGFIKGHKIAVNDNDFELINN
jgi:hypothetical protein